MSGLAFCTVVTSSYLRYAVALGARLRRYHPEAALHVLLIDPPDDLRPFADFPVSLIPMTEVRIPDIEAMKVYFDAFELSNALKPFLIHYLLEHGFERVIYLNSDILIVGRLDELLALMERANFVLTPHIIHPSLGNTGNPTNVMIADVGLYNGGLWGLSRHENAMGALEWLMGVLPAAGFFDIGQGRNCDQKLLPLAADLFPTGFEVLRHPGYNIAYWNLQERNVRKEGTRYFVDDQPVAFFHLSGFREDKADRISVHSKIHTFATVPVTADIVADYLASLPQDPRLAIRGYEFDRHEGRRLSHGRRRYYFERRTFSGYRRARMVKGAKMIVRGILHAVT